jgi:microsomal epoxide hydrolase
MLIGGTESLTYVEQFGTATLRAVVLVDGSIADERKPEETAQMWQWLKAAQVSRREFAAKFVRSMYSQPQPEAYYERITNASLRTPTNSAITLIANVERRGDWRPVLAKLDRPTLYVYAPRMKAQAAMLKAALPAARLELFAQAGHALFVDEAARFNRLLEEFLDAAR